MRKFLIALFLLCGTVSQIKADGFSTHVTVTTYSAPDSAKTKDGTSVDNKKIKNGTLRAVAISRNLLYAIPLGSIIEIEGYGQFTVRDTMAPSKKHYVDILIHQGGEHFKKENIKLKLIKKGKS